MLSVLQSVMPGVSVQQVIHVAAEFGIPPQAGSRKAACSRSAKAPSSPVRPASSRSSLVRVSAFIMSLHSLTRERKPNIHRPGGDFVPAAEGFLKLCQGPGLKEPRRSAQQSGCKLKSDQDFGTTRRITLTAGNSVRPAKSGSWIRSAGFPPRTRDSRRRDLAGVLEGLARQKANRMTHCRRGERRGRGEHTLTLGIGEPCIIRSSHRPGIESSCDGLCVGWEGVRPPRYLRRAPPGVWLRSVVLPR